MTGLQMHRIPDRTFRDLAEGGGGVPAVRQLAAVQYSKHVLLIRQVVESARAVEHEQAAQARHGYGLLAALQNRRRDMVDSVIRHPSVGAWARHTLQALSDPAARGQAVPGQLASLAAAAAVRGGLSCTAEVPVVDGAVLLPSVGRLARPAGAADEGVGIAVSEGRAVVTGGAWSARIPSGGTASGGSDEATGWQELRRLASTSAGERLEILIEDLDPWRMPGSANLGCRLTPAEVRRWQSILDDAWDLLVSHHHAIAAEIAATVTVFTPLAPPPRGQSSATSRETFGSIALSPPADACSLAVTLAHETQHAKLSALLDIVPMVLPDDGTRYYTPWRDDPRPLSGLLQGAYAFLGVADFWRYQRTVTDGGADAIWAETEFARWRDATGLVVDTLTSSARLTSGGEFFVAGMARTLESWADETVSADAAEHARLLAEEHQARWNRTNLPGRSPAAR